MQLGIGRWLSDFFRKHNNSNDNKMKDRDTIYIWGENLECTFSVEKADQTTGDNGKIELLSVIDEQFEDILSGLSEVLQEEICDRIREDLL